MTDLRYWLWMQLGIGANVDFESILDFFGGPRGLYDASVLEWAQCDSLTPARIDKLASVSLDDAERIIDECNNNSWDIIAYDDARYPELLKEIKCPPAVLYVSGDITCLEDRLAVAIVGTRRASEYSLKAAQYLANGIANCGAVIVSGGALGVDSAAHLGALEAQGRTVAVLGCGLADNYLKSNSDIRRRIVESGGALITEYPPHVRADKTTFPQRNRIISGLSRATIVAEAALKSGSLITADYARKQGRDVFAVPASIFDPDFQGTNKLIDEGAFVATSPYSVLRRYSDEYYTLDLTAAQTMYKISDVNLGANVPEKKQLAFDTTQSSREDSVQRQNKISALTGVNKTVYDALTQTPRSTEEIEEATSLSSVKILTALTVLEVQGLVSKYEGDRYFKV